MTQERQPGFDTLAVHAGAQPDPATGARITPIYQTTAFVFDDADQAAALFNLQVFGNIYSRIMNPTNAVLEERVAALEGGTAALAAASGHAAQLLVFHTLMEPGRRVRRGTPALWRLGQPVQPRVQEVRLAREMGRCRRSRQLQARGHAARPRRSSSKASPIPAASSSTSRPSPKIANKAGVPLIVDNTLATPYLIRPIEWGADIVVHSPTKFLGGHGNSMGGVIVDGGKFDWGERQVSRLCPSQPLLSRHDACARLSAISPSPSPPACWACAISGRRSRR